MRTAYSRETAPLLMPSRIAASMASSSPIRERAEAEREGHLQHSFSYDDRRQDVDDDPRHVQFDEIEDHSPPRSAPFLQGPVSVFRENPLPPGLHKGRAPVVKGLRPPAQGALFMPKMNNPKAPLSRRLRQRPTTDGGFSDGGEMFLDSEFEHNRRVTAHCVAQEFNHIEMLDIIGTRCTFATSINAEVIHFKLKGWTNGDAFIFSSFGSCVFWNCSQTAETQVIDFLKEACDEDVLLDESEIDTFEYTRYAHADSPSEFRIVNGKFVLPYSSVAPGGSRNEGDVATRVAVSYGLATSIKLDSLESQISETIKVTQSIPEQLAQYGKIPMSKQEVSQKIGQLYIVKSSVNLMFDILDEPDYFWEHDQLKVIYSRVRKLVDIDSRVEVMNKRLDVLEQLLEILRAEKTEQHAARLEWIVIWLIVVEIMLGVSDIVLQFI